MRAFRISGDWRDAPLFTYALFVLSGVAPAALIVAKDASFGAGVRFAAGAGGLLAVATLALPLLRKGRGRHVAR